MEKSRLGVSKPDSETNKDGSAATRNNGNNNMIQYETFESSSGDEMSRCIFES